MAGAHARVSRAGCAGRTTRPAHARHPGTGQPGWPRPAGRSGPGQHAEPGRGRHLRSGHAGRDRAGDQGVQQAGGRRLLHRYLAVPHRRGGGQPRRVHRAGVLPRPAALARRGEPDPGHLACGGHPGDRGLVARHGCAAAGRDTAGRSPAGRPAGPGRGHSRGGGACPAGPGAHPPVRDPAGHVPGREPRLPGHAANRADRPDSPVVRPADRGCRGGRGGERGAAGTALGAALRTRRSRSLAVAAPHPEAAAGTAGGRAGDPAARCRPAAGRPAARQRQPARILALHHAAGDRQPGPDHHPADRYRPGGYDARTSGGGRLHRRDPVSGRRAARQRRAQHGGPATVYRAVRRGQPPRRERPLPDDHWLARPADLAAVPAGRHLRTRRCSPCSAMPTRPATP